MRYETQNDMPLFYQKLKESLTYSMAWGNSSIRNFEKWREEARKVLLDCMQPAPPVAAFDKEVIDIERREGYTVEKILFNVSEYSRVPAYLLVPLRGRDHFVHVITSRPWAPFLNREREDGTSVSVWRHL